MNIRVRLNKFYEGKDAVVIVKCADGEEQLEGKYIVGQHFSDRTIVALVFDTEVSFHPALAKRYRLVPLGGGHFSVNHREGWICISGRSDTYGTEPDREFTRRALEAALPTYATHVGSAFPYPSE